MLIDYPEFFKDLETIKVATVMINVATTAKYLAAWLTQKTYKFYIVLIFSVAAIISGCFYASHPIELNDTLDCRLFLGDTSESLLNRA